GAKGSGESVQPATSPSPTSTVTAEPSTTTQPRTATTNPTAAAAPVAERLEEGFEGIGPSTRQDLDALAAAVADGHQPWRVDPVQVAEAYLVERGIDQPQMGQYATASPTRGRVPFDAGGIGGTVVIGRVGGNPLPYVVSLESTRVAVDHIERSMDTVRLHLTSQALGLVRARAGRLVAEGSAWDTSPARAG